MWRERSAQIRGGAAITTSALVPCVGSGPRAVHGCASAHQQHSSNEHSRPRHHIGTSIWQGAQNATHNRSRHAKATSHSNPQAAMHKNARGLETFGT
eukprot:830860-Alexandrium_andersonii.AAC.1